MVVLLVHLEQLVNLVVKDQEGKMVIPDLKDIL